MKKAWRRRKAEQRHVERKWPAVVIGVLALATIVTLIAVLQKTTRQSQTTDYEGIIVDRWADYAETDQGSQPRLRLVVESKDGKRLTVRVDPNVYESAKVGMRIKSSAGQIVLIDSTKNPN